MEKAEFLLYSLKNLVNFCIESKNSGIGDVIYDLITCFDYTKESNRFLINSIQTNSLTRKQLIKDFVNRYSENLPEIKKINVFFDKLAENEKFCFMIIEESLSQEFMAKLNFELQSLNDPHFDKEKNIEQHNELFKDILDNYSITTLNTDKKIRIGEKDRQKRICRFCSKTMSDGVTFKNEAHAISEALGNKTLIFNEECDSCNSLFGQTIEKDLITYLNIYRTFFEIPNKKNKIPSILGKNFEYSNCGTKNSVLKIISDEVTSNQEIPIENLTLNINEKILHQNVYKTLIKYALSIIEKVEPTKFDKTIEWITSKNFKEKLPKIAILSSYHFFKKQPGLVVYIRKNDNIHIPYAVGEFRFTSFVFVFIIPTFFENEPDFSIQDNFDVFWKNFNMYNRCKEFRFEDFSDSIIREMQINLKMSTS